MRDRFFWVPFINVHSLLVVCMHIKLIIQFLISRSLTFVSHNQLFSGSIILIPERNQSVLFDSNVNVTYNCVVDEGREAIWQFRGVLITGVLKDFLEERGVAFFIEGPTVSETSIIITQFARHVFDDDLAVVCAAIDGSSRPPEIEFSPTYYVRTVG